MIRITEAPKIFFGKNDAIQSVISDFRIDLFEVPSVDYASANPRYTFRLAEQENLWQYYFALFDRIRRSIDLPFQMTMEGFASEDYPQLEALREALANLLIHTDFFSRAKPRIRVFTNRIEFFNPGSLPKPLATIMKEDISLPRNGIIAKLFRIVKISENGGYGFDKMIRGWKHAYKDKPEFYADIDFVKATFIYGIKDYGKGGPKGGPKTLTERQREVYNLIQGNPSISRIAMAKNLSINVSALRKHLDALIKKEIIQREGPLKGGFWKIIKDENTVQ